MTRARLIEKVIAEWLEKSTEFTVHDDGTAVLITDGHWQVEINHSQLAEALDAELDSILRASVPA